jgi:hypothetical protein
MNEQLEPRRKEPRWRIRKRLPKSPVAGLGLNAAMPQSEGRRSFFKKAFLSVATAALIATAPADVGASIAPYTEAAAAVFVVRGPAGGAVDAQSAIQNVINTASLYSTGRFGVRMSISFGHQSFGIATPLTFLATSNIEICNGNLVALAGLAGNPLVQFGDGTAGNRPYNCSLRSINLECNRISEGILFNDSVGHRVTDVDVHAQVTYGLRTTTNSGSGIFGGVNIRQYYSGETGYDLTANHTAYGFDIGAADDILEGCFSSYCLSPLRVTANGTVQFVGCHFFNGASDGTDSLIVDSTGSAPRLFTGCYLDNGLVRFTDGFQGVFSGCIFLKTGAGNQTSALQLVTSTALADASGLVVNGNIFNFGSYSNGVINFTTTGAGSWATNKKISWSGNSRSDGSTYPYAIVQWQDFGTIDSSGHVIFGHTVSNTLAGIVGPRLQSFGTTQATAAFALLMIGNNTTPSSLNLGKSRGSALGTFGALTNGTDIGAINFFGDDTVNYNFIGSQIRGIARSTWSASSHSADLTFATTSGSGALTDRTRLDKDGNWIPVLTSTYTMGGSGSSWLAGYFDETILKGTDTITAHAGGGRASATALNAGFNNVTVVASAADSVVLPAAATGKWIVVRNSGANAMQVFAAGTDTVEGIAGATGISHATTKSAIYYAIGTAWFRILSA